MSRVDILGRSSVHDFGFTLTERDRRWNLTRRAMEAHDVDCLVVAGFNTGFGGAIAHLRWLTNLDCEGFLVFPTADEPTLFTFEADAKLASDPATWISDWRSDMPWFARGLVNRLREIGAPDVIGLVALSEYAGFPAATYRALEAAYPRARFDDAATWYAPLRWHKSTEEIRCFEIGCEIGQAVLDAVKNTAGIGVRDIDVRRAINDVRTARGAEMNSFLLYAQGANVMHGGESGLCYEPGFDNKLAAGDVIVTEICCRFQGYEIEFNQPFVVGHADSEWDTIFATAALSFTAGVEALQPGVSAYHLEQVMREPLDAAGFTWRYPFFHGSGLSDEPPVSTTHFSNHHAPWTDDMPITAGMIINFEPHVATVDKWRPHSPVRDTDPPRRGASLGVPVLVTGSGPRLLMPDWTPAPLVIA
jgi:Xaa-Pro aminopeptidase